MKAVCSWAKILPISLLLLISHLSFSQVLVNISDQASSAKPDPSFAWSDSKLTLGGYTVTVGNTYDSTSQSYDVLVYVLDEDGNLEWEETYGNGSRNEYGTAVVTDADDNIYIGAVSLSMADSSSDLLIISYDKYGTLLWADSMDRGGDDLCADIGLSSNEEYVYVLGSSVDTSSFDFDFLLVAYNIVAEEVSWTTVYDREGYDDIGMLMAVEEGGSIVVSGGSGSSTSEWEITTLTFDSENLGAIDEESISTSSGVGFDQPNELLKGYDGNLYITGASAQPTGGYYLYTMKLDSNLNMVWRDSIGSTGTDNRGLSISQDIYGNIYVSGYVEENNQREFVVVSYSSTGGQRWLKTLFSGSPGVSLSKKIRWNNLGFLVAVGERMESVSRTIEIVGLDTAGNLKWQRHIPMPGTIDSSNLGIFIANNGNSTITGITYTDLGSNYITLHTEFWDRIKEVYDDTTYSAPYIENEIVVRFNPDLLSVSFVDNPRIQFDYLGNLIPDSVITAMNQKVGGGIDFATAMVEKVHKRMTTADTISISRDGNTVRIPKFWSRLVLALPETFVRSTYDEKAIADSLSTLEEHIWYASPQYLIEFMDIPNDDLWEDQLSMNNDANFTAATINIDPAWDIETGSDQIRVGVYDSGIDWRHEDFSITGTNTFNDSKVSDGWDYGTGMPLSTTPNPDDNGHGTSVAGIIGALRNNILGIAGIAGGDMTTGNSGVQLVGMKIEEEVTSNGITFNQPLPLSTVAMAIEEGAASSNPTTGFGGELNVMNFSFGTTQNSASLREAIRFAFENQVTLVAARGNWGNNQDPQLMASGFSFNNLTPEDDDLIYPACFFDPYIINVAGTGTDGERKIEGNGRQFSADPLDNKRRSMQGHGVDIAAPSTRELVWSTDGTNLGAEVDAYRRFGGTSAAAPHVSGVAAQMMSEQNDQGQFTPLSLAPDDIEFLIEQYAEDKGATGYDDETGAGLLDAEEILNNIEFPHNQIYHSGTPDSRLQTGVEINTLVNIPEQMFDLAPGFYEADRIQITDSYLEVFPPTTTIIDSWPLLSATIGISAANPLNGDIWESVQFNVQGNVVSATIVTNAWHIKTNLLSQQVDKWIPAHPDEIRTAFSLHLRNPSGTTSYEEEINEHPKLRLYPNPADDQLFVTIEGVVQNNINISIFDLAGREVVGAFVPSPRIELQKTSLNISGLANGMYLCSVNIDGQILQKKFIKR